MYPQNYDLKNIYDTHSGLELLKKNVNCIYEIKSLTN